MEKELNAYSLKPGDLKLLGKAVETQDDWYNKLKKPVQITHQINIMSNDPKWPSS